MIRTSTWRGLVVLEKNNGGVFPYRPWNPTATPPVWSRNGEVRRNHDFGDSRGRLQWFKFCTWRMFLGDECDFFSGKKREKTNTHTHTHKINITMTAIFVETFPTHKTKQHDGTWITADGRGCLVKNNWGTVMTHFVFISGELPPSQMLKLVAMKKRPGLKQMWTPQQITGLGFCPFDSGQIPKISQSLN